MGVLWSKDRGLADPESPNYSVDRALQEAAEAIAKASSFASL